MTTGPIRFGFEAKGSGVVGSSDLVHARPRRPHSTPITLSVKEFRMLKRDGTPRASSTLVLYRTRLFGGSFLYLFPSYFRSKGKL
jgi:hypothetical protein